MNERPRSRKVTALAAAVLSLSVAGTALLAGPASASAFLAHRALPAHRVFQARPTARTVVTFTWGGGLADQMGALPVFQRLRMHATFYVPSGLVCQPAVSPGCARMPYLTLADVRRIAAGGNEIGGLSVEHVPLTGLPVAEAGREICDDRVNLTRWGFRVTDFAYPFAEVSRTLQVLARRCGYNSGLGTGQLRGAGLCLQCAIAETIPPANPYLLRAPIEVSSVGTSWSAATFESIVSDARRHGGGWIIFTVHDVCARTCALGVTVPELTRVLSWLSRQRGNGVSVQTVRQVIGGPVRPAVAGPVPQRIAPPGVRNPRLSAVAADGVPACYQSGRYGTNHATFRYQSRGGPGGAGAEVISLSRRKSGTAQLVPALDLGACAPQVSAGRSYTVGAWYKSSQPVVFNLYYRTAIGTWKFWVTSPPLDASPDWTQARWNSPAVPAGVSAVSFGLALRSDGTIATSRYSLIPARPGQAGLITLIVAAALIAAALLAVAGRRYRARLLARGQPR